MDHGGVMMRGGVLIKREGGQPSSKGKGRGGSRQKGGGGRVDDLGER